MNKTNYIKILNKIKNSPGCWNQKYWYFDRDGLDKDNKPKTRTFRKRKNKIK